MAAAASSVRVRAAARVQRACSGAAPQRLTAARRAAPRVHRSHAGVVVLASGPPTPSQVLGVEAGEAWEALLDTPWDAKPKKWRSFLAVKSDKAATSGFLFGQYAAPVSAPANGLAFSLPSGRQDAWKRLLCNLVHFRQNYLIALGCLALSALQKPLELLFLLAAVVLVVSSSSTLFDRLWLFAHSDRVFKYVEFEEPRKLSGGPVANETSVWGVPRLAIQLLSAAVAAVAAALQWRTFGGLLLAGLLTALPTVLLHALLRPIDIYDGGSWAELTGGVQRRRALQLLKRTYTAVTGGGAA